MLIVFSGMDGAGKSTQIDLLLDDLKNKGQNPVYLWTRGGYTPNLEFLKRIIRVIGGKAAPPSGENPQRERAFKNPRIRKRWLFLSLLDLLWIYGLKIRWWQMWNRTVVCDRYLLDTRIDFRINFPGDQVEDWLLWKILERMTPEPDVAFLMLVPVAESMKRSKEKGEPFQDPSEIRKRRKVLYLDLAADWISLDGTKSIPEIQAEIYRQVQELQTPQSASTGN